MKNVVHNLVGSVFKETFLCWLLCCTCLNYLLTYLHIIVSFTHWPTLVVTHYTIIAVT